MADKNTKKPGEDDEFSDDATPVELAGETEEEESEWEDGDVEDPDEDF